MPSSVSVAARDHFADFLTRGPSLLVATCSASGAARLSRAAAARLGGDGSLRLAISIPEGIGTLEDLSTTGAIALKAALPSTHVTFQAKGRDARVVLWPEAPQ